MYIRARFTVVVLLLLLFLFPHISPISRTRGHTRRLPFPYHRYIPKKKKKKTREKEEKITDEKVHIYVLVLYCCLYWFIYQAYFLSGDMYIRARFTVVVLLLLLLLFPHISPISRTRGHRRRLFPFHTIATSKKTNKTREKEEKITDEKASPDLIGGKGKK